MIFIKYFKKLFIWSVPFQIILEILKSLNIIFYFNKFLRLCESQYFKLLLKDDIL